MKMLVDFFPPEADVGCLHPQVYHRHPMHMLYCLCHSVVAKLTQFAPPGMTLALQHVTQNDDDRYSS